MVAMGGPSNTHVAARTVLIIDRDESVCRMLRFALQSAGFSVLTASSPSQGIAALRRKCVQAVVLDLGRPDMPADMVLKWLRRHRCKAPAAPQWVIISAQEEQDVARRCGPVGEHFMAEPFDPWRLVQLLEKMVPTEEE